MNAGGIGANRVRSTAIGNAFGRLRSACADTRPTLGYITRVARECTANEPRSMRLAIDSHLA